MTPTKDARHRRAVNAIPHHLPFQTTSFVGREQAVKECLTLFQATRLLTITGAGGGGKTRLAMRLTELSADQFRDGAWFVDLAPLADDARVPDVVAAALGIAEEPGRSASETLARHLASQRVLMVLDNCEHLLVGCAKLARTLLAAAPHLKILATSRELLGVQGETAFAVPTLSLPDPYRSHDLDAVRACEAVQLFVDRALLVRQDFTLDAESGPVVAEICRRLDGIPFAIELAAARVRVLSVQQILERLHDRFRLLAGGRGALPRQQTLRASIQWSYDQLTDDERRLLRRVSVFAGGWALEAAAACGEDWDEFEVLDLLARLVDKSLVIVDRHDREDTRYRCLETVRQFGEEQLIEAGEWQTAKNRHRDWVLAFAERAAETKSGGGHSNYHDRLELEIDNLRAALAWCRDDPKGAEDALRLAAAVEWFWSIRGHYHEGRQWLADILGRGPFPASPTLAGVLKGAGNMAWRQDDYEEARRYFERCLEVRRQLGDELGIAGALGSLGNVSQTLGELETARSLFEQSLEICRRHGHKIWLGTGLTCLGNVSRFLRDFEKSRASLEEAIALTEETGDRVTGAIAIGAMGDLLVDLDRFGEAIPYFERALALQKEMGDLHSLGFSQLSLGSAFGRKGEFTRARALFQEALPALVGLGARLPVAGGLEDLARLLLLEKDAVKATRLLGAASTGREAIASPASPGRQVELEGMAMEARVVLGEAGYAIEWERGRAMTLEQAIADAFGDPRQAGGDGPAKTTKPPSR